MQSAHKTLVWKGPSPLAPSPISLQPHIPQRTAHTPAWWQLCVVPVFP